MLLILFYVTYKQRADLKAQGEKHGQAEGVSARKLASLPSCFYLLCFIVHYSEHGRLLL